MSGFDLPTREGWCVEGYFRNDKKCISKYYLKSKIESKQDAKKQFLKDTGCFENNFEKIDVLECCM